MSNFDKVKYLKFTAKDDYEDKVSFKDVVIDLVTDCLMCGTISREVNGQNISVDLTELKDTSKMFKEISFFAKVVDTGTYFLLDENMNIIYKSEGYVPSLFDYYHVDGRGYGDYIELTVDNVSNGHLAHKNERKIDFNDEEDWECVCDTIDYDKGMNDAYNLILGIIEQSENKSNIVASIISFINNFKKNKKMKN